MYRDEEAANDAAVAAGQLQEEADAELVGRDDLLAGTRLQYVELTIHISKQYNLNSEIK